MLNLDSYDFNAWRQRVIAVEDANSVNCRADAESANLRHISDAQFFGFVKQTSIS
jgi:hypothetical protein